METRIYSPQVAKFGILFLPLRLCVFVRDIPTFGCGSAALRLYGDSYFDAKKISRASLTMAS